MLCPENAGLSFELIDRAPYIWLAQQDTRIIDQITRSEVIGAVNDHVVRGKNTHRVGRLKTIGVQCHRDMRIDVMDGISGGLPFESTHIRLPVNDLPLEVGLLHRVELHDAKSPHASGRQVHESRAAQSTGADAQHFGVLQTLLPQEFDVREYEVAAVTTKLLRR